MGFKILLLLLLVSTVSATIIQILNKYLNFSSAGVLVVSLLLGMILGQIVFWIASR